ncbi:glutamyl-tRNA amidotransferase [Starkeya sp. ORNL1]|uniref:amidase family protein n=1 Tax=Starkeya sp. ORNL1 TaxID=2709380 RepID=UPI0014646432|nr:amidase family protein [Starkeya sp. ORNL1]QJP16899.1 glutamyl-tRNA amidotransferase [Starkeya sp. ORNL1]
MHSLAEISRRLAEGEVTPVALMEAALAGVRTAEHVFISLSEEEARRDAEAAAARWKLGRALGPLDGIPVAIKDLIDVRGSRTTAGSLTRSDIAPAQADAPVIVALKARGVIPFGKTNLSEFAFSGLGLNPHFGTPIADFAGGEPRAPGGSSSGSAIAVQRGIVVAAIGTDTAGSIRVPAAFNGLVGYKASVARYDMRGVHPLAPSLDSLGPICRTVGDCTRLDAAMRGLAAPTATPAKIAELRFVVDEGVFEDGELQPAVRDNLLGVMAALSGQGARVVCTRVRAVAGALDVVARFGWLGAAEARALLRDVVEGPRRDRIDPRVRTRLEAAAMLDPEQVARMRQARRELIVAIARELDGAVLVLPTVKHVAPLLAPLEADIDLFARVNLASLSLTMIGSLLDMPGIALPSGTGEAGLPTSILFSLPSGEDDRLLAAGLAIEVALRQSHQGNPA